MSGPLTANPGMEVKQLRFMIAQDDVMVEAEGHVVSAEGWSGTTPAEGLEPGTAHAFGLAVMLKSASPPSFETFTWVEQVTLTS